MLLGGGVQSRLPNFLIVGAARAGTTSLYEYIRQHPQVFLPHNKEPMFFAFKGQKPSFSGPGDDKEINLKSVDSIKAYKQLFEGVQDEAAVGEASALYLYSPVAAERIRHHVPDAKIIVILRNPVERAYSSFLYTIRDRREVVSDFSKALEMEEERIGKGWEHIWHYRAMGYYNEQLQRYYSCFDESQIKVFLYEDLRENPRALLKEVFAFLDVDPDFEPDFSLQYNQGGVPKMALLNKFLTKPSRLKAWLKPMMPLPIVRMYTELKHNNLEKPPLDPAVKELLIDQYRPDIEALSLRLRRDLSSWMKV